MISTFERKFIPGGLVLKSPTQPTVRTHLSQVIDWTSLVIYFSLLVIKCYKSEISKLPMHSSESFQGIGVGMCVQRCYAGQIMHEVKINFQCEIVLSSCRKSVYN